MAPNGGGAVLYGQASAIEVATRPAAASFREAGARLSGEVRCEARSACCHSQPMPRMSSPYARPSAHFTHGATR